MRTQKKTLNILPHKQNENSLQELKDFCIVSLVGSYTYQKAEEKQKNM